MPMGTDDAHCHRLPPGRLATFVFHIGYRVPPHPSPQPRGACVPSSRLSQRRQAPVPTRPKGDSTLIPRV